MNTDEQKDSIDSVLKCISQIEQDICTCGKYDCVKSIPLVNACPVHEKELYDKQLKQFRGTESLLELFNYQKQEHLYRPKLTDFKTYQMNNTDKHPQTVYIKIDYSNKIYGNNIPEYILSKYYSDKIVNLHHLQELSNVYIFTPEELEALLQKERENPQWVNVKERLPETSMDVLAAKNNGRIFQMSYHAAFDTCKRTFQWCAFGDWLDQHSQVTHWMPLPQPPKK